MKTERMLPAVYRQSSDMRTMCRLFDVELSLIEYYTNHILDCYSPEHCPDKLITNLASHIGFKYNTLKSIMYNRVVLKHFIKHLIRYRGSQTGIANAAAIDVRYRQVYSNPQWFNPETCEWEDDPKYQTQVPMDYNEGISMSTVWVDADNMNGIIYLFLISPSLVGNGSKAERMRRLLDFLYLQEYVRPVGMYLLPLAATKVDAQTDITVKAIRVPEVELNSNNGVVGTPNASTSHPYDRIHFARTEDGDLNDEPWVRTLYHSQVAGNLTHQYFNRPVYHITGKFLYYDHDELMSVFSDASGKLGMKVGDSLYNPNVSYETGDPMSLEEEHKGMFTDEPLEYNDKVGWGKRYIQSPEMTQYLEVPDPEGDYPVYLFKADEGKRQEDFMINLYSDDLAPDAQYILDVDAMFTHDDNEPELLIP